MSFLPVGSVFTSFTKWIHVQCEPSLARPEDKQLSVMMWVHIRVGCLILREVVEHVQP